MRTLTPPHAKASPSSRLKLYTHTLCPYAQRVGLTLKEKRVPFDLIHIDLSNKPSFFTRRVPRGLVPAIELPDGEILVESLDLCKWLDENYEGTSLIPKEGTPQRDACWKLVEEVSGRVVSSGLSAIAGATGRSWGIGTNPSSKQIQTLQESLDILEESIEAHAGPYLAGEAVSLADLVIYPFVERFDVALPIATSEGTRVRDVNARVAQWMEFMAQRPSCAWASANRALLEKAYRKHMCLDFFDYTTYDQWDLHPHNL